MTKQEILEAINRNPVFYLATAEGDQPRVRGMLLYQADESGIVFHTGIMRDLYRQINENSKAELCFNSNGVQIRISGILEEEDDINLKKEIANHPTRTFLKPWHDSIGDEQFYHDLAVFRMRNGVATLWTMEKNLEPKEIVQL